MIDWSIVAPSFLTALVEWVEAFTIVLAVSLSIGWRAAIGASLAGLATLTMLTLAAGRLLVTCLDIGWLQLVVGVFLMLSGVRWLAKAMARHAGLKALHDEAVVIRPISASADDDRRGVDQVRQPPSYVGIPPDEAMRRKPVHRSFLPVPRSVETSRQVKVGRRCS